MAQTTITRQPTMADINELDGRMNATITYTSFANLPAKTGFYTVQYGTTSTDSDAPVTGDSKARWWHVAQFYGSNARITQIAAEVFYNKDTIWVRHKHDSTWSAWNKIVKNGVENVSSSFTVSYSKGTISQKTAYRTGNVVTLQFVITTNAAISAGEVITPTLSISNSALNPIARQPGSTNSSRVTAINIYPTGCSASASAGIESGAAFWLCFTYVCAGN